MQKMPLLNLKFVISTHAGTGEKNFAYFKFTLLEGP